MMKTEQESVRQLLLSTITQLCQNGLPYKKDIKIQGLLAITIDDNDIFVVQLNENIGLGSERVHQSAAGVQEMTTTVAVSKEFPVVDKSVDIHMASRPGPGELAMRSGAQLDLASAMSCKAKVVTHNFVAKPNRDAFTHNGEHGKLAEFNTSMVGKDAPTDNSMLLSTFTIPTVNYSVMKAFPSNDCFRDHNTDQIDFVFPEFQPSGSADPGDPGRLTCPTVTANSGAPNVQPGFLANIGPAQGYQTFPGVLAAPQPTAKLELSSIGKRILPQAIAQNVSYGGQPQVSIKKAKQESRLPRRPRESTEKRFRCQMCNLTYYYKKHLKFHMQQKHGLQQNMT